jgi:phospholipid/cholesterol/gamma-HCH transport system substrate-binding protein
MKVQNLRVKIGALLIFFLICFGIFIYLYKEAGGRIPFSSAYSVNVMVPDAFALVQNADVRAAGVKIGVVDSVNNVGDTAKVKIDVDSKYAPIYKNAHVEIGTKTLVGENYLELDPGTPSAGKVPKNGTLPLANSTDAVQLDKILDAFDPKTRAAVQKDLSTFSVGLGEGQNLNDTLGALDPTVVNTGAVMSILSGEKQQVADLVDQFGQVMKAFADKQQAVRTLATSAKATAVATSARDQQLENAFNALPAFLDQTRSTTSQLGTFAKTATPVIENLDTASIRLAPAIRDLGPAAASTLTLTRALPAFIKNVNPVLGNLSSFSTATSPAVTGINALLSQLNPFLTYLEPYNAELGSFMANVGSAVDSIDAVGHLARVLPVVSATTLSNTSASEAALLQALFSSGIFQNAPVHESANAYPAPGTVGSPQSPPAGFTYPHVAAAG